MMRVGFPAPAGMDPIEKGALTWPAGIPRTRGDGPPASCCASAKRSDSPHPRGWTPGRARCRKCLDGFPAPAGMDPRRTLPLRRRGWIPRTRGDGPVRERFEIRKAGDSPHPRGWTLAVVHRLRLPRGFPAPAGMDPSSTTGWRRRCGIPRTRGDGPGDGQDDSESARDSPHPRGWTPSTFFHRSDDDGFPAPAGMDPRRCSLC